MVATSPEPTPADPDDLSSNVPCVSLRAKSADIRTRHPVLVFILRLLGEHSDKRAWRRGAEGEVEVGRQLLKLGAEGKVLHSVPVGGCGTDIDHLVIGPHRRQFSRPANWLTALVAASRWCLTHDRSRSPRW